jgi:hypothetical protein
VFFLISHFSSSLLFILIPIVLSCVLLILLPPPVTYLSHLLFLLSFVFFHLTHSPLAPSVLWLLLLHIQITTVECLWNIYYRLQSCRPTVLLHSFFFFDNVVITRDKIEIRPRVSLFYPSQFITKSNRVDSFFLFLRHSLLTIVSARLFARYVACPAGLPRTLLRSIHVVAR